MPADPVPFQTLRLACRPPGDSSAQVYAALFGPQGADLLASDRTEWCNHGVAPWTLSHAGHDVGIGGFRIGYARGGLELRMDLLPDVRGQGLASEFVTEALDYAAEVLRETDVFAAVGQEHATAAWVLKKNGFRPDPRGSDDATPDITVLRRTLR
ncbi:GCN5-related protein N-acetyltransferase [Roseibacterium elongatum DSM 19469]|uniref:GCN5-related protein N-acetyltransferase n=1 Tax=Roseicyclus elongatus DSM 19469 TaxID=1294273 RepID=W8S9I4_9RHOB|nr:GNAT family N-acetyltransferase [Roseibacterium elongatum]AHM05666.1 GCN5-related protein N-acetyltransferase [Roseibacterium elongatum DSM 19469]